MALGRQRSRATNQNDLTVRDPNRPHEALPHHSSFHALTGCRSCRSMTNFCTLFTRMTALGVDNPAFERLKRARSGRPRIRRLAGDRTGGFGHSRLRDALMGGATRPLLGSMRAPVLIFLLKPIGRAGLSGAVDLLQ